MRRLYRAVLIWLRTDFTWPRCLDQAEDLGPYVVVARRDGFLWIEPRR